MPCHLAVHGFWACGVEVQHVREIGTGLVFFLLGRVSVAFLFLVILFSVSSARIDTQEVDGIIC